MRSYSYYYVLCPLIVRLEAKPFAPSQKIEEGAPWDKMEGLGEDINEKEKE